MTNVRVFGFNKLHIIVNIIKVLMGLMLLRLTDFDEMNNNVLI